MENEAPSDPFGNVPEQRLLRYLLTDAIERWREGCKQELRWLFLYTDSEDVPFSFRWVCANIDIDPDSLRQKLLDRKRDIDFFGRSVSQLCKRM